MYGLAVIALEFRLQVYGVAESRRDLVRDRGVRRDVFNRPLLHQIDVGFWADPGDAARPVPRQYSSYSGFVPRVGVAVFRPRIIVIVPKIPAIRIVDVAVAILVDTVGTRVDRIGKNIAGDLGKRGINASPKDDYHHHARATAPAVGGHRPSPLRVDLRQIVRRCASPKETAKHKDYNARKQSYPFQLD